MKARAGWLIAVAALSGCATAQSPSSGASSTLTGEEAHAEIARLEQRIARLETTIGLPPAAAPATSGDERSYRKAEGEKADHAPREAAAPAQIAPASPGTAPAPPAAPPPVVARPVAAPAPDEEVQPTRRNETATVAVAKSSHRRSSRCKGVDRAAGDICEASERICRLADSLAGELEAARSCSRAREECMRSRQLAGSCDY